MKFENNEDKEMNLQVSRKKKKKERKGPVPGARTRMSAEFSKATLDA